MTSSAPRADHAGWRAHFQNLREEFRRAVERRPTLKHLIFQPLNLPIHLPTPPPGPGPDDAGKTRDYRPMPDFLHRTIRRTICRYEAWALAPGDRYRLPAVTPDLASSPLLRPGRGRSDSPKSSGPEGAPITTPAGLVDPSLLSARGCYGIGFLYGQTSEADTFTQLSSRAWLALPGPLASNPGDERRGPYPLFQQLPVYSERPYPHFAGVSLCRTRIDLTEQHEQSACWVGLLYRTLRQHTPSYLDQDGTLGVLLRTENGEETVIGCSEDEALSDQFPLDSLRFRITALAADLFTASLPVFDTLLQHAGGASPLPDGPAHSHPNRRGHSGSASAVAKENEVFPPVRLTAVERAMQVYLRDSNLSVREIARLVGCDCSLLYRDDRFKRLREAHQRRLPKGSKSKEGNLEAELGEEDER